MHGDPKRVSVRAAFDRQRRAVEGGGHKRGQRIERKSPDLARLASPRRALRAACGCRGDRRFRPSARPPQHGRPVEQKKPRAAGFAHGVKIGVAAGDQRLARPTGVGRGALDLGGDRRRLLLDHGLEQRLLVGEVVVERAARHAGSRDDVRRRRSRHSPFR